MGTLNLDTVDWQDRLIGQSVRFYDVNHKHQPDRPRAGVIVGQSVDRGCCHLAVFADPSQDVNLPKIRHEMNVLMVTDPSMRVPGITKVALLTPDQNVQPYPSAGPEADEDEARGGLHLNDIPKAEPIITLDSTDEGATKAEPEWNETTEIEEPEATVLSQKVNWAEMIEKWDYAKKLIACCSEYRVLDDSTIEFDAYVAGEDLPIVRILHLQGEDETRTGYTLRVANAGGRMALHLDEILSPTRQDSEIKILINVAEAIINKVNNSPTQEEANTRIKAILSDYRKGQLTLGA